MEKRAPAGAETHAGDMQKLYLTALAQCRGATQNVKPQKYDPLWSPKNMFFLPLSAKTLGPATSWGGGDFIYKEVVWRS